MKESSKLSLPTLLTPRIHTEAKVNVVKDPAVTVAVEEIPRSNHLRQQLYQHALALKSGTKVSERYQAAEALCALGPDATSARSWLVCRSVLETALLRDKSVHVRKSVARALGELGDQAAQPVLQQALENDQDQFVRMRAHDALELLIYQR